MRKNILPAILIFEFIVIAFCCIVSTFRRHQNVIEKKEENWGRAIPNKGVSSEIKLKSRSRIIITNPKIWMTPKKIQEAHKKFSPWKNPNRIEPPKGVGCEFTIPTACYVEDCPKIAGMYFMEYGCDDARKEQLKAENSKAIEMYEYKK